MTQMDPSLKPMRPSGEWGPLDVTSYSAAYVERAQARSTEAMTEQDIQDVIDAYVRLAPSTPSNSASTASRSTAVTATSSTPSSGRAPTSATTRGAATWSVVPSSRPPSSLRSARPWTGSAGDQLYLSRSTSSRISPPRSLETPEELGVILGALVDAGVDVLDASIRRFDVPAFEGNDLSLAGWAKKLTGAVTMAVGSVRIGKSLRDSRIEGVAPVVDNIPQLEERIGSGEFDLIAIGRLHLADPAFGVDPARRWSATRVRSSGYMRAA